MQKTLGFTLLELLISIVILGVLVSLATPSFKQMIEKNQITTTTNDMVSALLLARSTAVTQGQDVVVAKITKWDDGWTVTDADNKVILRHNPTSSKLSITSVGDKLVNALTYTAQGKISTALVPGTDYFKVSIGNHKTCVNFSASGRPVTGNCP
ncbi:MAG: prepilin-type N-terminal cleavage/methylation domain-containing protein [Gammaproteobacteria bacterium]|nr:prepilin-type N-terminal cleavage/methylation domain-containing protein [Gammaproteobacteria bacterium]